MKNYLCINGKKTELTKEQMEKLGIIEDTSFSISKDRKAVMVGEYKFIVLKEDKESETMELLLEKSLKDMEFGPNNDYRVSDVRKVVENFGEKIERIVGTENLIEHSVNLIAVSGLKDFGSITAKMSLLTFDKAREYIEKLDEYKLDSWWWLVSPLSTKKHDVEYSVMCVSPFGYLFNDGSDYNLSGVRPFCILKSNIFQS